MHPSVMSFVEGIVPQVVGLRVLEVGSYDVNGSPRELLGDWAESYLGCDIRPGPGVDVVCDAAECDRLGRFDVVISTEMMEHARDWRAALRGMVRATRLDGLLVLTMRGIGAGRHEHPEDHWRYTLELIDVSLDRLGVAARVTHDPGYGYGEGVFAIGRRYSVRDDDLADLHAEPAPQS